MLTAEVLTSFQAIVGADNCLSQPEELATYECDGLVHLKARPLLVVLPATRDEVVQVVKRCYELGWPLVPRGSGTGLSGGALPVVGGIVLGLSRLRKIVEIDFDNQWMTVEPGVINAEITRRLAPRGYYYAPDPSSQLVCSIGGNVAENSGGAHCLKYGFTSHHVLGLEVVLADGRVVTLGGPVVDSPGYDLRGVMVGSEGTLGVVTRATVRICRKPEATRTLLAAFDGTAAAGQAVSKIVARGVVPAAIEMMDRMVIDALRTVLGVRLPDVAAVLLLDVDGTRAEVDHTLEAARAACVDSGALSVEEPTSEAERAALWKARKSAFTALGRIRPNYIVQDGVIPRSAIASVLGSIAALAEEHGVQVANVFHAGDGNLHPLILYDGSVPGETERADRCAGAIVRICLQHHGSITGEHGVGADKAAYMGEMFTEADLDSMNQLRCAFDPLVRLNPGKVFPTPRLCGDVPGQYVAHPTESAGLAGRG